jgi:hypothetical protein
MNKLEKGSNVTMQASQQSNKSQPLKKQQKTIEEEKIEYARSAYLSEKRLHIKNDIGYKMGDKHKLKSERQGSRIYQVHQK